MKKLISTSFTGRLALSFMLVFTGIAHFTNTEPMIAMLPEIIPYKEKTVHATGIVELTAALGLIIKRTSRITSVLLILFFLCVLPANIIGSMKKIELGGMEYGPVYLIFRIPLQLFFIGWTYYFGLRINHQAN
ncbi:MAG: DoxX family protein [Flavobacteriaceae bacterium]